MKFAFTLAALSLVFAPEMALGQSKEYLISNIRTMYDEAVAFEEMGLAECEQQSKVITDFDGTAWWDHEAIEETMEISQCIYPVRYEIIEVRIRWWDGEERLKLYAHDSELFFIYRTHSSHEEEMSYRYYFHRDECIRLLVKDKTESNDAENREVPIGTAAFNEALLDVLSIPFSR